MGRHDNDNDDMESNRSPNNLAVRGGSVAIGVGTILTFLWSQVHEAHTRINAVEIKQEGLAKDGEFRSKQIEEIWAKVKDCSSK